MAVRYCGVCGVLEERHHHPAAPTPTSATVTSKTRDTVRMAFHYRLEVAD
jgi:hypothetical protein